MITEDELYKFASLFFGRKSGFYQQTLAGAYIAVHEDIMLDHIRQHVEGQITLGVPVIGDNDLCKFIVWDSDDGLGSLDVMEAYLKSLGFVVYRANVSLKRKREGHLYMFINPGIESSVAYNFAQAMILAAGLVLAQGGRKVPGSIESFPKQANANGGLGNCIRLVLGVNLKPGSLERGWWRDVPPNIEEQIAFMPVFNSAADIYLQADLRGKLLTEPEHTKHISGGTDIMQLIPQDWQVWTKPDKIITRCANCRESFHDNKPSGHLCIYPNGRFRCVAGCNGSQVWQAFKRLKRLSNG